jgi:aconitate hydratase
VGLARMAPGEPVECRVAHADGTTAILRLAHSFSAAEIAWFRAGSALNLTGARGAAEASGDVERAAHFQQ